VEPVLNVSQGIPDAYSTTFTSGTVLCPTGNFAAISWNTAVLGAPASQAAFSALGLTNLAFKNLGFLNGTYGIYAGNTNNPSCWWSKFENLYFVGQTVIGRSITNYQHCDFTRNRVFNGAWADYHGIDVASASLAPGNSTYYDIYAVTPISSSTNMLNRLVTFLTTATTGGAADNNEFKMDRIQCNRFNQTTTTQAATMVNTQATFTVTDGTKWAVGMPVTFSATANGFNAGQIYFVASASGNTLSVASTYGGAAIAATGATAVNIINSGFPAFEMIALSGSAMTNAVIDNLDVEGGGTCAALFQNCNGFRVSMAQVPLTTQSTVSVCGRSFLNATLFSPQSCNTDMDGSGVGRAYQFFGAKNANASIGNLGAGIWYDSVSGKATLSLGEGFATASQGLLTFDPATTNGVAGPKNFGIGQLGNLISGATYTVAQLSTCFVNTTSAAAMTLPSVIAGNAGQWVEFFNPTAGNQTINTDGVQLINNITGRTAITLAAGASVRLTAIQYGASSYTWYIAGASSTMTSGTIAAPT